MARRSRVEGSYALRKKLRRLDPEMRKEIADVVIEGLEAIKRDAQSMVPVDSGDLRDSIEVQFSKRDGVSGLVGPGAKAAEIVRRKSDSKTSFGGWKFRLSKRNKAALWQFFKGYWVEFGTKGGEIKGRGALGRGKRVVIRIGDDVRSVMSVKIPPQPARPFMAPAYLANREWIKQRAKIALENVLEKVSRG